MIAIIKTLSIIINRCTVIASSTMSAIVTKVNVINITTTTTTTTIIMIIIIIVIRGGGGGRRQPPPASRTAAGQSIL